MGGVRRTGWVDCNIKEQFKVRIIMFDFYARVKYM